MLNLKEIEKNGVKSQITSLKQLKKLADEEKKVLLSKNAIYQASFIFSLSARNVLCMMENGLWEIKE